MSTVHNVSDLIGGRLDAAVANALGTKYVEYGAAVCWVGQSMTDREGYYFAPSTDWREGGPIIEKRQIEVRYLSPGVWSARIGTGTYIMGPTPLVAAMRALVMAVTGDKVVQPW